MWPTPTPLPTQPAPDLPFDPVEIGDNFAEGIIQGWNWFNAQPISTVIWIIVIATIIVFGLMSIKNHIESI